MTPEILATAAIFYRHNLFVLPGGDKQPALREWAELGAMARRGERLPWEQTKAMFRASNATAVGHLVLHGNVVLDVDTKRPPKQLAELLAMDRPGPAVSTSRGAHYFFRALPARFPRSKNPLAEFRGPGMYCELPPSNGKTWHRPLAMPIPALPNELLDAVRKLKPKRQKPAAEPSPAVAEDLETAPDLEAERAAWTVALPDLSWSPDGQHGRAHCPFHQDSRPSFSVYVAEEGGFRWRCHAGCFDSGFYHSGTLGDFLRLFRLNTDAGRSAVQQQQSHFTDWKLANLEGDALLLFEAILADAVHLGLDLGQQIGGLSYRRLARLSGLEDVQQRPDGSTVLSSGGRRIRRALADLHRAGCAVHTGIGGDGIPRKAWRATAISLPCQDPSAATIKPRSNVAPDGDNFNVARQSDSFNVTPSETERDDRGGGESPEERTE